MTEITAEKQARMFAGKDNWTTVAAEEAGIHSVRMSDGPNGLRIEAENKLGFAMSHPATLYPTASLSACSFDRKLQYELGEHLGRESAENGVQVLLGPGVNHKRSPLCGRNFEYYSEDPYLSGELASAYVKGVQDQGVGTSLKHYAGNSREYGRMIQNSIIDERALHEIYLAQFERVVRTSQPWTIMAAYNRLNGKYCCENKELLDLAREKWGFDGLYVSDWGAVPDPADCLKAGLNLEMPGGEHGSDERILKALEEGSVTIEMLEENTKRLKQLADRTSSLKQYEDVSDRLAFAQRAAAESAVLLKNNGVLPLHRDESIALIGPFAKEPRIQGTGSSKVNASEADCLFDAMKEERLVFSYAQGFTMSPETVNEMLEDQALRLAERCSKVIVIAGLPEGDEAEGYDRKHMRLPENQNHLIRALQQVNRNIIVVLQCGAPVELPWRNNVSGILCMYLAGCRSGKAALDLLTGNVNPCGKLAETWPRHLEDTPCFNTFHKNLLQAQYRESIFTGYRYYSTAGIDTAFPFGYGLSYTTFAYRNLKKEISDDTVKITLEVTNTGTTAGKEIVQLYIGKKDSRIGRPLKELKGFEKILLEPGETKDVTFLLDARSFAYYDTAAKDWLVEAGTYEIGIGASSEDIRLETTVFRNGTTKPYSTISTDYLSAAKDGFTQTAFESVLGHSIEEAKVQRPFTVNTSLTELQEVGLGRLLKGIIDLIRPKLDLPGVTDEMIMEVPVRMALMSSDQITWKTVNTIVDFFNGKASIFRVLKNLNKKK